VTTKYLYLKNSLQKKNIKKNLSKDFLKFFNELNSEIKNNNKTLNVLNKEFKLNFKLKDLKKFKKYKTIAIIGMGGSILGAEAIYNFLEKKINKKIYFFNDLDINEISSFKKKENYQKVLFLIISKSGNTIESLSNFFAFKILKKNAKNIIIISEQKNNTLLSLSKKFNLFFIEHKKNVGGRYSVLSEVGIVPAYLMGVNIFKLRSNIRKFLEKKNISFLKESSIKLSSFIESKKFNNLVFLNYAPELNKFLFWCQQLIAESLGKKGKGFFPVISTAPKDHHSLLQLYIDGPRDKLFHVFSLENRSSEKLNLKKILNKKNFLDNKRLDTIKKAQKDALILSLRENKIPYREFKIKEINEQVLGELFSYFMLETVMIGKIIKSNPYTQPAVEQVKIYTKKLLS
tara:strand:+ start:132 stop:1337 length:1206 start_codon:yes stop_codon:yes gene_type:complete